MLNSSTLHIAKGAKGVLPETGPLRLVALSQTHIMIENVYSTVYQLA